MASGGPAVPKGFPPLSVGTQEEPKVSLQVPPVGEAPDVVEEEIPEELGCTIRFDNQGWDDAPSEVDEDETGPLNHTFNCNRGPLGVSSLSLSAFGEKLKADKPSLADTLSADAVVRGTGFKWVRGETLGRGSLGVVSQGLDQETGQIFAVKEVNIDQNDVNDLRFKRELENEIKIGKALQHPRIVSYLGHDYLDGCLYIYLEYMAGGSMSQVLSQFGPFEESLVGVYTRELLEGLEYLHTREPPVVHRDIKGANVLVGLDCRVKLSDFGCSKRTSDTMSHTMKGSIPWMAPEVIKNTGYGRMADIWSFGCVVIEMATGRSPWGKFDNVMAAMCKIAMSDATPPIPESLSVAGQNFIRRCLQRDKEKRPTATALLQDELVRDLCTED